MPQEQQNTDVMTDAIKEAAIDHIEGILKSGIEVKANQISGTYDKIPDLIGDISKSGDPTYNIEDIRSEGDEYVINGTVVFDPPGLNAENRSFVISGNVEISAAEPTRGKFAVHFNSLSAEQKQGLDTIVVDLDEMRVSKEVIDNAAKQILEQANETTPAGLGATH